MTYDEAKLAVVIAIEANLSSHPTRTAAAVLEAIGFRQMQERIEDFKARALLDCSDYVNPLRSERDQARALADQLMTGIEHDIAESHRHCTHSPCTLRALRPVYEARDWK